MAEARVVTTARGEDLRSLVGYVLPRPGAALTARVLRTHLRTRLPEHMVPGVLTFLESLPRTPQGKIDRRALPAPREDGATSAASAAPRDLFELKLIRIWEELLGMKSVRIDDHFFELGGHSLLAVRLAGTIEREFGLQISLASLFEAPTIEQLAARLRRHAEVPEMERCLVRIQPGGPRPPVFWPHPIGGSVLCYFTLGQLLGDRQPIFGLQSFGLLRDELPDSSIEDMAERYLREVRQVQPAGPYSLAGWSMGGVLAYEMACQLRESGEEVDFLALLDVARVRRLLDVYRANVRAVTNFIPRPHPGRLVFLRSEEATRSRPDLEPTWGWAELALAGTDVQLVPGDHYALLKRSLAGAWAEPLKAALAKRDSDFA